MRWETMLVGQCAKTGKQLAGEITCCAIILPPFSTEEIIEYHTIA